jgi:hypothetical protein
MKTNFRSLFLALSISAFFAACSDDDEVLPVAPPTITGVEIGSDNSKIGYAGSDFHIDAAITAPGSIAEIQVEIHPESGAGWEYDSVYTEGFAGLNNAQFHKHIDIPADAALGHYHLHLTVTDKNGAKVDIEEEIEIKQDATLPSISGLAVELEGNELHLEAAIAAPNRIAEVIVEIHGTWENEYTYTDADMVGQTAYNLHKHIDISAAPAGHYHVHIKVVDQAGKEREFEDHFDKP